MGSPIYKWEPEINTTLIYYEDYISNYQYYILIPKLFNDAVSVSVVILSEMMTNQ